MDSEKRARVKLIKGRDLYNIFSCHLVGALLLDTREEELFSQSHAYNSFNLPLSLEGQDLNQQIGEIVSQFNVQITKVIMIYEDDSELQKSDVLQAFLFAPITLFLLKGFEEFRKSYPYLCSVNRETHSNSSSPTAEEDHVDSSVDDSISSKSLDSSLSLSEGFCGFSIADLPSDIEKKLKSPLIGRRSSKEIKTRRISRRTPNAWNLPTMEQKEIEDALTRMIDAEKIREHNAKKHKEDEVAKEKSEEGSNVEEEKEKDEIMNEVNEKKEKKNKKEKEKEKKEKKKKKEEKQKQKKKKEKGEKEKKKQKGKKEKVKEGEGNSDHANEDAKHSHDSQVSPENGKDKSKKLKKKKLYKSLLGRNGMAKEKVHQNEPKEESAREEKVVQGNVSNETEEERGLYIEEETEPAGSLSGFELATVSWPTRITNNVYLGDWESATSKMVIDTLNITYIVNCTKERNPQEGREDVVYFQVPIEDHGTKNILQYFEPSSQFIDQAVNEKHKILIHCQMGVSRSATIVVAYLMKSKRWPMEKALNYVQQRRYIIEPNFGFIEQLQQWENQLTKPTQLVEAC